MGLYIIGDFFINKKGQRNNLNLTLLLFF